MKTRSAKKIKQEPAEEVQLSKAARRRANREAEMTQAASIPASKQQQQLARVNEMHNKAQSTWDRQMRALKEENKSLLSKIRTMTDVEGAAKIQSTFERKIRTLTLELSALRNENSILNARIEQQDEEEEEDDDESESDEDDEESGSASEESTGQDESESEPELERDNQDNQDLERRIVRKKAKIADLRSRLEKRKEINQHLQARNDNLEERLATKRIKSQALKVEFNESKASDKPLRQSVRHLQGQLDKDQIVIMDLLKENVELKKPVGVREQELIDARQEQFARHEYIVSELYGENNRLREAVERYQREGSVDSMEMSTTRPLHL